MQCAARLLLLLLPVWARMQYLGEDTWVEMARHPPESMMVPLSGEPLWLSNGDPRPCKAILSSHRAACSGVKIPIPCSGLSGVQERILERTGIRCSNNLTLRTFCPASCGPDRTRTIRVPVDSEPPRRANRSNAPQGTGDALTQPPASSCPMVQPDQGCQGPLEKCCAKAIDVGRKASLILDEMASHNCFGFNELQGVRGNCSPSLPGRGRRRWSQKRHHCETRNT